MAAEVETVHDPALKYGLEFGVAFLHDIMRPGDRAVAERLFASGAVQVCYFRRLVLCCCCFDGCTDQHCTKRVALMINLCCWP